MTEAMTEAMKGIPTISSELMSLIRQYTAAASPELAARIYKYSGKASYDVGFFPPPSAESPESPSLDTSAGCNSRSALPMEALSGLLDARNSLKRTDVTVTRRKVNADGSMIYVKEVERGNKSGGFEKVQGSEKEVGAPSHLAPGVADRTALVPKAYSKEGGAWKALSQEKSQFNEKRKLKSSANVTVMQLNVWFVDNFFNDRASMLLGLIQEEDPDIVKLQEVTSRLLELIKANEYVQQHFVLSDTTATTLAPYGCLMLVRRSLYDSCCRNATFMLYKLPTTMARSMIGMFLELFPGRPSFFGTVHLESMRTSTSCAMREAQLKSIFGSSLDCFWSAGVVSGDFNFDPSDPEQQKLDDLATSYYVNGQGKGHSSRLVDAWVVASGRQDCSGPSCTTLHNMNKRIDRCMIRSNSLIDITATAIRRIGLDKLPCASKSDKCFPSDHIGLITNLRMSTK